MLFWLISWVLIAIGIWAYFATQQYNSGTSDTKSLFDIFFDISLLFIIFGSVIFLLAFLGAIGSLRENTCLLKTFAAFLIIIFLAEVAIVIAVFALSATVRLKLQDILKEEAVRDYRDNINTQNVIDWFQETFECCGVGSTGYKIWEENKYFNCSSQGFEACSVPYSCCIDPYTFDSEVANTRCGAGVLEDTVSQAEAAAIIHTNGCVDAAIQTAKDNMFLIGGVGVGIVIPQLLGILLAKILWSQIEDQKARWGG
ncbi:hypothetical protein EB796_009880 [Bugula neritina]|uniref:Tetraspanin n=1 Tax=Bugula neritina TaxID=10212 RepID=A0A7J7K1I1_BUGNE|nr:hypothetical protein EB796_009880 [Bugula neritina]